MPGATRDDVFQLIGYIEGDLRGVNAKFTELRSMLAQGAMERKDEPAFSCAKCGFDYISERSLTFHLYNVHGVGELPPFSPEEAIA